MSLRTRHITFTVGPLMTALLLCGCQAAPKQKTSTQPRPQASTPEPVRQAKGWPMKRGNELQWSAMAFPTGEAATSAVGIEKGMPSQVRVNHPFDYEMVVTNLSNRQLRDVVVSDECSEGFNMSGSQPQATVDQGVLRWNVGNLQAHESKTIKVSGVANAEGTIRSCTAVAYDSLLCATSTVIQPKVQLTKSGPSSALTCDEVVYQYQVRNSGSGVARGLVITDTLPDGMSAVDGGKTVRHTVGDLDAGDSKSFSSSVKVSRMGQFASKAVVNGDGISSDSNEVATTFSTPNLSISMSCPGEQYVGRPSKVEIVVSNTGNAVSANTMLMSTMGQSATFVSASDGGRESRAGVEWKLGNLAPNATKTVTLTLGATTGGTLRPTASVKGTCASQVSDSCEILYQGIPAILLEVVDVEDPIEVGQNVTYVITATNQGSAADTNIRISCTLEDNVVYDTSSGASQGRLQGNQVIFAPLPNLAPGREATWKINVRAKTAGDVRFSVQMETDQLTRPVSETEATNLY